MPDVASNSIVAFPNRKREECREDFQEYLVNGTGAVKVKSKIYRPKEAQIIRIKFRKGNWVKRVFLSLTLSVLLYFLTDCALGAIYPLPPHIAKIVIVVKPGQSPFSIASSIQHAGNLWPLVYKIEQQADFKPLYPGEKLVIGG